MRARLQDLSFTREGRQRLTIELDGDFRQSFDALRDKPVEVEVKRWRKRRSLDANAMMWSICSKIADVTGVTKEEVYRRNIREVGKFTPLPIKADAIDDFSAIWAGHGIGWFIDIVDDSKLDGYKLVFAYHGSSCYDTKNMSRLIDCVMQDAKAVGVDTLTPHEMGRLMEEWRPK